MKISKRIAVVAVLLSMLLCSCANNNVSSLVQNTSDDTSSVTSIPLDTSKEAMINRAGKIKDGSTEEEVYEIMGGEPDTLFGSGIYGEAYYVNGNKKELIIIQYMSGVSSVAYWNFNTDEYIGILKKQFDENSQTE